MRGFGPGTYGDAFADVYDEWYADISDVAATVAYLLSPAGRNISGQTIGVDGNVEAL